MEYLRIGNRLVPATRNAKGELKVDVEAVEIPRPDGGQDVIVKVPCLEIVSSRPAEEDED